MFERMDLLHARVGQHRNFDKVSHNPFSGAVGASRGGEMPEISPAHLVW